MLSGCSLVTRDGQLVEEDDGELWSPLLVPDELHGDVDDDPEAATTLGPRAHTKCYMTMRESSGPYVRGDTHRRPVCSYRPHVCRSEKRTSSKAAMDSLNVSMTRARERVGWCEY